jgi:plasmid stabilization system protein ParE
MSVALKILTEAADDIKEYATWYKNISPSLSIRFVSQLYDGFAKIVDNPDAWFNLAPRVRRYKLPNFPYLILFFEEPGYIVVFAVIHEKRDPKNWKRRLSKK